MGTTINCPLCPYYEQTTSYGTELIKCNNTDCKRRIEMGMSIEEHIAQLKKLKSFHNGSYGASVKVAIDTMRKYQQLEDFARWVAVEVIDEEMWTYNHLSFAELACRKLVQLEIMQESDGEYTYEVDESETSRRII